MSMRSHYCGLVTEALLGQSVVKDMRIATYKKIMHLNLLPQGQSERFKRVEAMVETMDEHFGSCTNHGECEAVCPKEVSIEFIARLNRDFMKASFREALSPKSTNTGGGA